MEETNLEFNPPERWLDSPEPEEREKELAAFESEQLSAKQDTFFKRGLLGKIMDTVFNKFFYLFEWFETNTITDDWVDTSSGVSASVTGGVGGLAFTTGTTLNGYAQIDRRGLQFQSILRWDRFQAFKTSFSVTSLSEITCYLVRGYAGFVFSASSYFGFKIVNDSLYGVSSSTGASESTVLLLGPNTSPVFTVVTTYEIKAILIPRERVEFYILNSTTSEYELRGTLRTQFPTDTTDQGYANIIARTTNTTSKILDTSYFEYIQER